MKKSMTQPLRENKVQDSNKIDMDRLMANSGMPVWRRPFREDPRRQEAIERNANVPDADYREGGGIMETDQEGGATYMTRPLKRNFGA